jgi:ankyrin repeat protein
MLRKRFLVLSFVLLSSFFSLAASVGQGSSPVLRVDTIQFYEGGENAPERSQIVYLSRLPRSSTRFVYCELEGKNLFYNVSNNDIKLSFRYYYPDGSLMGEPSYDITISSDWDDTFLYGSYGWVEPGNWSVGTYAVEAFINGNKVGDAQFSIYEDAPDATSKPGIKFEKMLFFEGEIKAPEPAQRTYLSRFPCSSTRYVFCQVDGENLLYNIREQDIDLICKFYFPDGSLMGEPRADLTIKKDWDLFSLWTGWGWEEPGNWPAGTYSVEAFIKGSKVGDAQFSVYDDAPDAASKPEFKLEKLQFFEAGSEPPEKSLRAYLSQFPRSSTRFVFCEIDGINNLYKNREHTHKVSWQYYSPDGSLMGEPSGDFLIKTDWYDTWDQHGWGWDEPGSWPVGTYTVKVLIDGNKAGEAQFSILEDAPASSQSSTSAEDINALLLTAVNEGQASSVKDLLIRGADANIKDASGVPALTIAVSKNFYRIARDLLDSGADISVQDSKGRTALDWASFDKNEELASLLQAAKALKLKSSWKGSWDDPDEDLFTFEMQLNTDNANNVDGIIDWTYISTKREDSKSKVGLSAREYVKGTYDPNTRMVAISGYKKDDPQSVIALDQYKLILLTDGNNLNGKTYRYGDWKGRFLAVEGMVQDMSEAIGKGKIEEVKKLIAQGADVNARDSGASAIMKAAGSGNIEIMQALLSVKDADVNANIYGFSALMLAACSGHAEVVQALIARGADINAKDENGNTALSHANREMGASKASDKKKEEKFLKIIELLKQAGAKSESSLSL